MILCLCPNPSIDTLVTVDDLAPGKVHRARSEERFPGGKGVHVALAAAELGADVTLLAFWAGPTGQWIRQQCQAAGIRCAGPLLSGWSRACITFKSQGPYDETELLGTGPQIDAKDVQAFEAEFAELAKDAIVTMSGSWPPGALAGGYARLLAKYQPAILDCTGTEFELALKSRPSTVHLNRQEASELTGQPDPAAAARHLAKQCRVAVVTAGAEGAYFCAGEQVIHTVCRIERPLSAVGSGDCLVAGLAVAGERKLPLRHAAALATACGAANCLRPELGMLHRSDVEKLLPKVIVQEMR